ncbi:MAG: DUF3363 domain-containing protein [Pseudomonadota bacterium]
MSGRDGFEIRLGKIRTQSGARKAVGFFKQVERAAKRGGRSASRGRLSGRSPTPMMFYRRVVVKASFKLHAGGGHVGLKRHVDYIQRDGTDERGEPAKLYGSVVERDVMEFNDDGMAKAIAEDWKDDRHHFRFIVAPEDADQLQDLSAYTRDLVSEMERELDTKLEWVAANHYDTANPHTHLIVRGLRNDGRDLVIPRRYLSHGLRRQAEQLAQDELGPVTQREGRMRLAGTVEAERITDLDRTLMRQVEQGIVELSGPAQKGRVWHRQLLVRRLNFLSSLGLAEAQGKGRWMLASDALGQLRTMSERRELFARLHQAMDRDAAVPITQDNLFDPNGSFSTPVAGWVKQFGKIDDTRGRGFIVLETTDGRLVGASVSDDETFQTMRKGQVVAFEPHPKGPRPIDRSIATFAEANGGLYSEVQHATESDRVSPAYAQAHARRLEALRRRKLVIRRADGTWRIPSDYLERAARYEAERASRLPTQVHRDSRLTLTEMRTARGATWMDHQLVEGGESSVGSPYMLKALKARQTLLRGFGFAVHNQSKAPADLVEKLTAMDLNEAAKSVSAETGKPYAALGNRKAVEGIYREAIDRPSGRFAVIERSKEFTLVPWRPIMERRLGRNIMGRVSASGISWDVTGRVGPSR